MNIMAQPDRRDRPTRLASQLVQLRRWRAEVLPGGLNKEPSWEILLILYAGRALPSPTVTELTRSTNATFSTALRWVHTLKDRGMVELTPGGRGTNRIFVKLTSRGEALMTSCLDGFGMSEIAADAIPAV
ncbi:hypothetical protein LZ518_08550 [Sphingomonas sp. RB56-2]|uniref:MarR family transcriptional regulator n=1 Tax=Sphingomonas brevis TaxID=2908206 RepID=A0ABT0SA15_9SPHN|nr:hypothetical protein [Sphingomonas brevis]MCL6741178.1 hypothetical protein [Sphingomonas brevis]